MEQRAHSIKTLILAATIFGLCLTLAAVYYKNSHALSADQVTIQRADSADRHVYGDPEAPIKVVEFSDYQCPYCAKVHPHLKRLVDESGGHISWEYRHLPLPNHPLAKPTAVVLECVAKELGHETFWLFTDNIFANQNRLSTEYITEVATNFGLSEAELSACQADPDIAELIENDTKTASLLGGSGTPFTVLLYPDNTYKTVIGANQYEHWVSLTEAYVN